MGCSLKWNKNSFKIFFSLFFLLHPTSNSYLGIEAKDNVESAVYSTHTGQVRDQIRKAHYWEQGKGIKSKARDEGCNEYIRI